jgi:hypothetical protein
MADNPSNPLQAEIDRLRADKSALISEFNKAATNPDDELTPKLIKSEVIKLVPTALETIRNLLVHAESEATRGKLATYVLSIGLGTLKTPASEEDGINALIESLRATPDIPAE